MYQHYVAFELNNGCYLLPSSAFSILEHHRTWPEWQVLSRAVSRIWTLHNHFRFSSATVVDLKSGGGQSVYQYSWKCRFPFDKLVDLLQCLSNRCPFFLLGDKGLWSSRVVFLRRRKWIFFSFFVRDSFFHRFVAERSRTCHQSGRHRPATICPTANGLISILLIKQDNFPEC